MAAGQVQREADRIERDPTDVGGHIQALFDSYMGAQHTPWRLLDTHHRHMERLCHTLPRRLWEITRDDAKFLARTGLVGGAVTLTGKPSCFILNHRLQQTRASAQDDSGVDETGNKRNGERASVVSDCESLERNVVCALKI